ncbi:MAG: hypothetical protein HC802_16665 [Caldilineaceae bacterium]|nr:hypothetical protein [Caldilineaceae bacterium]
MAKPPSLKQRIRDGELLIGVAVPMDATRSQIEGILARDDYAYISTDSQHAAYDEERLIQFCSIAQELGVHVQFRIKHTHLAFLVGNYLDLGPTGVEVPQVEDAATVAQAVDYFYYPQTGRRSWGGAARWGFSGQDRLEYAEWWNNTGVLWMQIESLHAVTHAARLARSGVDCLSWGPADLQFDIEAHAHHPLQSDDECVRHVLQQLEGTGVRLAYRNFTPDLRNKYIDMGVTVLLERPKE